VTRAILWFRRDLRLADHPALAAAAADHREVVPLFVVDPRFTRRAGAPRRAFLADCLAALDASIGGTLVCRYGDPVDVVARLAAEVGADEVVVTRDFGPYGRQRDVEVAARLTRDGRRLRGAGTPYAVAPGTVTKADGGPYAVFTPFSRAWRSAGWPAPLDTPGDVRWVGAPQIPTEGLPPRPDPGCELPAAGEPAAHGRWAAFVAAGGDGLDGYHEHRDQPGRPGTSRLSPYLRWGVVHPRTLLAELGDSRAHEVFRSELAWREFYADVLHHQPDTAWRNLNRRMDALPVDTDARARARFAAWQAGRTGYPIVDAGMRQLAATGWMHNRVRMIVASFLVKDLHLPWQWGARHFLDRLVDGDLASNSHGWQWTAGTGTDAAPYFRVFNPVAQGERYDPDGAYVRRWVPEVADLPDRFVHAPWRRPGGVPAGYLAPIVDHAAERADALQRYQAVTSTR
jgi:deoxyribodipyrimidine photo-lyase